LKIRLCSTSKTRAKILDSFDIEYIQSPIDFNEDAIGEVSAKSFVYLVAKGKMDYAEKKYKLDIPLLVADTVVTDSSGKILRKAKSKEEAREFLLRQSGNEIKIITAAMLKSNKLEFYDISATVYKFNKFYLDKMQEYLDSNIWQDKAGACMVEGFCKEYIKSVNGLQSNAMGLQIEKIIPWLEW